MDSLTVFFSIFLFLHTAAMAGLTVWFIFHTKSRSARVNSLEKEWLSNLTAMQEVVNSLVTTVKVIDERVADHAVYVNAGRLTPQPRR